MWPWATSATSPPGLERAGDHAVGAAAGVLRASRRRASPHARCPSRAAPRGSPASCGPRRTRRPARGGLPSTSTWASKPARAAVSRARTHRVWSAPARTRPPPAGPRARSRGRRPSSVSGTSPRVVCLPERLHSVSPWRRRRMAAPGSAMCVASHAMSAGDLRPSDHRARGGTTPCAPCAARAGAGSPSKRCGSTASARRTGSAIRARSRSSSR